MKRYAVLLPDKVIYVFATFASPSSTRVDFYVNTYDSGGEIKKKELVAEFYSSQIVGWGLVIE